MKVKCNYCKNQVKFYMSFNANFSFLAILYSTVVSSAKLSLLEIALISAVGVLAVTVSLLVYSLYLRGSTGTLQTSVGSRFTYDGARKEPLPVHLPSPNTNGTKIAGEFHDSFPACNSLDDLDDGVPGVPDRIFVKSNVLGITSSTNLAINTFSSTSNNADDSPASTTLIKSKRELIRSKLSSRSNITSSTEVPVLHNSVRDALTKHVGVVSTSRSVSSNLQPTQAVDRLTAIPSTTPSGSLLVSLAIETKMTDTATSDISQTCADTNQSFSVPAHAAFPTVASSVLDSTNPQTQGLELVSIPSTTSSSGLQISLAQKLLQSKLRRQLTSNAVSTDPGNSLAENFVAKSDVLVAVTSTPAAAPPQASGGPHQAQISREKVLAERLKSLRESKY